MATNPYKRVTADAFEQMQLDAGVLLTNFNLASPFTTPNDSDILATTSGGINVVCEPQYEDLGEDVDNVPNNMKEFVKLTGWNCSMSFTSIKFNAENTRWALGAADSETLSSGAPTGTKKVVPRADINLADFADLYAAFPMADGGIYVVKLKNAVSTGGLNIQTTKNGKGTGQVTLTGYVSIDNQEDMPMEFYHIPGLVTPIRVTSVAGETTGKTALTTNYTLGTSESFVYKIGDTATDVYKGTSTATGWTAWNGTDEITAVTGKKITLAVSKDSVAIAAGSTTVTSKAAS